MCYYQVINGRRVRVLDDCPFSECPEDGGPASEPEGSLVALPCPPMMATEQQDQANDNLAKNT